MGRPILRIKYSASCPLSPSWPLRHPRAPWQLPRKRVRVTCSQQERAQGGHTVMAFFSLMRRQNGPTHSRQRQARFSGAPRSHGRLLHRDAPFEHRHHRRVPTPTEPNRSFAASYPSLMRHTRSTLTILCHSTRRRRRLPPRQTDLQGCGTLARAGPISRLERGSTPEATARVQHHGILYPGLHHRLKT
jgi:hypothetical protein